MEGGKFVRQTLAEGLNMAISVSLSCWLLTTEGPKIRGA